MTLAQKGFHEKENEKYLSHYGFSSVCVPVRVHTQLSTNKLRKIIR